MDKLKDAISQVTIGLINSLTYGKTIILNDTYHLYHYCEEEIISIYETDTDIEVMQCLTNGKEIIFEQL